jgi:PadR family transcriptional regulator PadR
MLWSGLEFAGPGENMKPSAKDQVAGKPQENKTHRETEGAPARAAAQKPSRTMTVILRAMAAGPLYKYGLRVIEITGLPSGTVYPVLQRLERDGLLQSHWEQQSIADAEQRPLRKYYKLTPCGRAAAMAAEG